MQRWPSALRLQRFHLSPSFCSKLLTFCCLSYLLTHRVNDRCGALFLYHGRIALRSTMKVKARLIFSLSIVIGYARGQCYYPGGDLAKDDRPCNQYAYTSLCCSSGYTCFDNALCIATADTGVPGLKLGLASRGTCTNPLWNQTACGNFCLSNVPPTAGLVRSAESSQATL